MSQQACAEFFAKAGVDPALQQEIAEALEGKEDLEAAVIAFVHLGVTHGYEFTPEEAAAKYQEITSDTGELDDEILEQAAGGKSGGQIAMDIFLPCSSSAGW